ncbi:hypothetical protein [Streptomyces varsoviensis]|uniref:Secreted protein n=1 Tax=Streptomyces varsoviensis TaxID=67373 RepID=A0ABR5J6K4_9ACTN|nr:hypothetical protein [Streptomyces varsoviensis]KOG88987.1 hypothetical protein ADK38_16745 [Streptomyces varsoviensis]
MTTERPRRQRRRRVTTAVTACAALAIALPLISACDPVDKAVDCGRLASTLSDDVSDLARTVHNTSAGSDEAKKSVDRLNKDLGRLAKSDDESVKKSVDALTKAVDEIDDAVAEDRRPDLSGLKDATSGLVKTCTPG